MLDDSVSSLLFSVPAEDSVDSTTLHISDRKTIEELSALLVRTHPAQPVDAAQTPLCVLEESNADGTTTRVTVWRDGKDVIFASSADAQSYRVPGAAAEFCRLTGFRKTERIGSLRHFSMICCKTTPKKPRIFEHPWQPFT